MGFAIGFLVLILVCVGVAWAHEHEDMENRVGNWIDCFNEQQSVIDKQLKELIQLRKENDSLVETANKLLTHDRDLHIRLDAAMTVNRSLKNEIQIATTERDIFKSALEDWKNAARSNYETIQKIESMCGQGVCAV